ncbi:MAG: hypothetical protein K2P75_06160 [Sphingobacteriaceae bacterium]|jgi:preprotein translocase subunit YajC|nr:hypothetical protein [Sphingobacteriaceae bacterium]
MKINIVVIAIIIAAILLFIYFVIKRNRKDQKKFENELNQRELTPDKHKDNKI